MKVVLYGVLRSVAGVKELSSAARSIHDLLEELAHLFGRRMGEYLYRQGAADSLTVVHNGKVLSKRERDEAHLDDKDIVYLLSPVGGG